MKRLEPPRERSRARLLARRIFVAWVAASAGACARPEPFVPRAPGLEIFHDGLTVDLKEREGDPARKGPIRYGLVIESVVAPPAIARASPGTSEERCAPGAASLEVDVEKRSEFSLHSGTFGVTVPEGTPVPIVDLALKDPSGSTACVRVPVEGDEIAWRSLDSFPFAARVAYTATAAAGPTVAGLSGVQAGELGLSDWWGPVRGTVSLGAGVAYCPDARCGGQRGNPTTHFAAVGAASVEAYPLVARGASLGAGVRYAPTVAWMGHDGLPQPTILHGLFGVIALLVEGPNRPRLHGEPTRPPATNLEVDIPVGVWTTAPGQGSKQSLVFGIDFGGSLGALDP